MEPMLRQSEKTESPFPASNEKSSSSQEADGSSSTGKTSFLSNLIKEYSIIKFVQRVLALHTFWDSKKMSLCKLWVHIWDCSNNQLMQISPLPPKVVRIGISGDCVNGNCICGGLPLCNTKVVCKFKFKCQPFNGI